MKKIILTGDDFGLSLSVNEGIEDAHRHGTLSCASLMMRGQAAKDAVERARRLSSLRVGLHLVLVDGLPVVPAEAIPHLVDERGRFSSFLFGAGVNFFFRPTVRQELESEIRAQFEAFRSTGLLLDHVNTHHHIHLHPTVSRIILKIGKDYGMRAMRLPYEPALPSWRSSRSRVFQRMGTSILVSPWVSLLRKRLRNEEVNSNDFVFGMNDTGHLDLDLVLRFLNQLPPGVTEIYFHPEISETDRADGNHARQREHEILVHPTLSQELLASGIQLISFSELSDSDH